MKKMAMIAAFAASLTLGGCINVDLGDGNSYSPSLGSVGSAEVVGDYAFTGTDVNGSTYGGTVSVKQNGDVYIARWDIAASGTVGAGSITGVGVMTDGVLSFGFQDNAIPGVVSYIKTNKGWSGIWAYDGDQKTSTEVWTRKN